MFMRLSWFSLLQKPIADTPDSFYMHRICRVFSDFIPKAVNVYRNGF